MHDDPRSPHQPSDRAAGFGADWDALARFAAGESTVAEAASVQSWLDRHPADAALVAFVRSGLDHDVGAPTVDIELALARVRARIDAEGSAATVGARTVAASSVASLDRYTDAVPSAVPTRPPLTISKGGGARWVARGGWNATRRAGLVAAAVVVVVVGANVARRASRADGTAGLAIVDAGRASARVYETRVGVRDSVLLADGSRVMLAPGSRLVVDARFDSARTVELEGAAYFDVKHDEAHPFTVRSRGTEIRDIGTAFSVSTDANGAVWVEVTEGVVAMRPMSAAASAFVELRAGDRGVVQGAPDSVAATGTTGRAGVAVSRGTVTPDDVAWTRGALTYRDAPLSLVQADLQRWYGLTLQVTDSVLQRRTLKMSFAGNSAAEAVDKIALALGAETVQRGDTVILRMPAR